LSTPFCGRGFVGLPGDPFGDIRPSLDHRRIAGDDLLYYQEYFCLPELPEREAEHDLRAWLTGLLYSLSADAPLPPELDGVDLTALPRDELPGFLRATMCIPRGHGLASMMVQPDKLPAWLPEDALEFYLAELEYSGLTGPLNYYRAFDLDWELLGAHQGRPVSVPSLYIGGDRDVVTIWAQESIARADEVLADHRGSVVIPDSGHWIQQEQPDAVKAELVNFLGGLTRQW
jgi:pimeloyl-ACP methyl ester carboxylesterase